MYVRLYIDNVICEMTAMVEKDLVMRRVIIDDYKAFVKMIKSSAAVKRIPEREAMMKYSMAWSMGTEIKNESMKRIDNILKVEAIPE